MKIKTKFNVGESVTVIHDNEIKSFKVVGIGVIAYSPEVVVVDYTLQIVAPDKWGNGGVLAKKVEEQCFRTIEKLAEYYVEKYGVAKIES